MRKAKGKYERSWAESRVRLKIILLQIVQKVFAVFMEPLTPDGKSFPPPKFLIQTEMMIDMYSPGVNYNRSYSSNYATLGVSFFSSKCVFFSVEA